MERTLTSTGRVLQGTECSSANAHRVAKTTRRSWKVATGDVTRPWHLRHAVRRAAEVAVEAGTGRKVVSRARKPAVALCAAGHTGRGDPPAYMPDEPDEAGRVLDGRGSHRYQRAAEVDAWVPRVGAASPLQCLGMAGSPLALPPRPLHCHQHCRVRKELGKDPHPLQPQNDRT